MESLSEIELPMRYMVSKKLTYLGWSDKYIVTIFFYKSTIQSIQYISSALIVHERKSLFCDRVGSN